MKNRPLLQRKHRAAKSPYLYAAKSMNESLVENRTYRKPARRRLAAKITETAHDINENIERSRRLLASAAAPALKRWRKAAAAAKRRASASSTRGKQSARLSCCGRAEHVAASGSACGHRVQQHNVNIGTGVRLRWRLRGADARDGAQKTCGGSMALAHRAAGALGGSETPSNQAVRRRHRLAAAGGLLVCRACAISRNWRLSGASWRGKHKGIGILLSCWWRAASWRRNVLQNGDSSAA
jgi:hypothetical protein